MSYIVIPVYDFACDGMRPGGVACPATVECMPANMGTDRLLDKAHQLIREDDWALVKTDDGWRHYCPDHAGQAAP